jgi:hypothetical protein
VIDGAESEARQSGVPSLSRVGGQSSCACSHRLPLPLCVARILSHSLHFAHTQITHHPLREASSFLVTPLPHHCRFTPLLASTGSGRVESGRETEALSRQHLVCPPSHPKKHPPLCSSVSVCLGEIDSIPPALHAPAGATGGRGVRCTTGRTASALL